MDTERARRGKQDGVDEEYGIQENADKSVVGLPELSAGAQDATDRVPGRIFLLKK
jgi:hypothetical protein